MDTHSATARTQPAVQVIATTVEGTRAALSTAVPLAIGSSARLVILVPRIDPHPRTCDEPADSTDFMVKRYQDLASELGGDASVRVCVCRDLSEMVTRMLDPDATIVVGGPSGRWLMSPEERLASRLTRLAKRVIFVASGPTSRKRRPFVPVAALLAGLMMPLGHTTAKAQQVQWSHETLLQFGARQRARDRKQLFEACSITRRRSTPTPIDARGDSDVPVFLTRDARVLDQSLNTATPGLIS